MVENNKIEAIKRFEQARAAWANLEYNLRVQDPTPLPKSIGQHLEKSGAWGETDRYIRTTDNVPGGHYVDHHMTFHYNGSWVLVRYVAKCVYEDGTSATYKKPAYVLVSQPVAEDLQMYLTDIKGYDHDADGST